MSSCCSFPTRFSSVFLDVSFSLSSASFISRLRTELPDAVVKETSDSSSSKISNLRGLRFFADVGLYSINTGLSWRASKSDPLNFTGAEEIGEHGELLLDSKCCSWSFTYCASNSFFFSIMSFSEISLSPTARFKIPNDWPTVSSSRTLDGPRQCLTSISSSRSSSA
ncbi:hypothetical protein OGATHE_001139 [Ogataea polymorpha]|uniref:Uncharacterized protein n=1 Tax=Ogataea polymorpha TaxID=460523 RepID=A0A9P8PSA1_9ASCO|nr:hypothetical protein OGATHE_001139 [Ogataea polymorpha]